MKTKLLKRIRKNFEFRWRNGNLFIFDKRKEIILEFISIDDFLNWFVNAYFGIYSYIKRYEKTNIRRTKKQYREIFKTI